MVGRKVCNLTRWHGVKQLYSSVYPLPTHLFIYHKISFSCREEYILYTLFRRAWKIKKNLWLLLKKSNELKAKQNCKISNMLAEQSTLGSLQQELRKYWLMVSYSKKKIWVKLNLSCLICLYYLLSKLLQSCFNISSFCFWSEVCNRKANCTPSPSLRLTTVSETETSHLA